MLIFKKEKKARDLALKHLKQVHECLMEARNTLEEYVVDNNELAEQKAKEVSKIESQADKLVLEIREVLLDGAFLPNIRSDVYKLVEAVDSIAGKAEKIAQFIVRQSPQVPDQFQAELQEIFQCSLSCFNELRKGLKAYFKPKGLFEDLQKHFTSVCKFESEVDELQAELTRKVFVSTMRLSEKIHLQQLIKKIGEIADLSEDAADELEFAAMKTVV